MVTEMTTRTPRNILVTGGCGFIGSAFIRFLFRETELRGKIVNLDSLTYAANPENVAEHIRDPRYVFVHDDISNQERVGEICDEHEIDAIIHFAAESHVDRSILGPILFVETNVLGTVRLLEVVRSRPHIHFHHVSTDEVYGSLGADGRFREDTPYHPNSPYAASKASSDHLVRAYGHTYGLGITLSNCSNNYGPYQFPEKLIPLMIMNMVDGKPLPVYGDGSNVRDWLYVDDHAEAIWGVATRGRAGETYNVGGNAERTNLDLLHTLIEHVAQQTNTSQKELRSRITFVKDRPGHDLRYAIDSSKIQRELDWTPRHDLTRGLMDTVAWYLSHPEWLDRVRSGEYRNWLEANYGSR